MRRLPLLLLLAAAGSAVNPDYCPIPPAILEARRFAQRPLGDCVHNVDREARLVLEGRPIVFRAGDGRTEISGQTSPGKPWRVRTGALTLGCSAITADFDRNGRADLLIGTGNFGTSRAPWSRLFFLLFDASGQPVPWQMYGFFSESRGKTVEDLLDLNGDGRAELLDLQWDEHYWTTGLYEARDAHWRRVEGRFGGFRFPHLVRSTESAIRPPEPSRLPDEANVLPATPVTLTSVTGEEIRFSDGRSSRGSPDTLVIDQPQLRRIYFSPRFAGFDPEALRELRDLAARRAPVYAILGGRAGQAIYLWATKP